MPTSASRPSSAVRSRSAPRHLRLLPNGDDEPFGEHLSHEPPASGAEPRAQREFTLPSRGPRQHQVRDVGARDQQHDSAPPASATPASGRRRPPPRGSAIPVPAESGLARRRPRPFPEPVPDSARRSSPSARQPGDRRAGSEPRDHRAALVATRVIAHLRRREGVRHRASRRRRAGISTSPAARRDLIRLAVQAARRADDLAIPAELRPPRAGGQHRRLVRARLASGVAEARPILGRTSERREERRCDRQSARNRSGLSASPRFSVGTRTASRPRFLAPAPDAVQVVRDRDGGFRKLAIRG